MLMILVDICLSGFLTSLYLTVPKARNVKILIYGYSAEGIPIRLRHTLTMFLMALRRVLQLRNIVMSDTRMTTFDSAGENCTADYRP